MSATAAPGGHKPLPNQLSLFTRRPQPKEKRMPAATQPKRSPKAKPPTRSALSTTTPAGIRAHDADAQAAALQSRVDAWRANWLRYLLSVCAVEDYKLALRVLLARLADLGDGPRFDRQRVAELCAGASTPPNKIAAIARAKEPVAVLVQLAADLLWQDDKPTTALCDYDVEALAEGAGLYLAAHWKADLAGPLTVQFFELLPLAQLHDYARAVKLSNIPLNDELRSKLVLMLIAHKGTRDKLPACIRPVALDPPKKSRAK